MLPSKYAVRYHILHEKSSPIIAFLLPWRTTQACGLSRSPLPVRPSGTRPGPGPPGRPNLYAMAGLVRKIDVTDERRRKEFIPLVIPMLPGPEPAGAHPGGLGIASLGGRGAR